MAKESSMAAQPKGERRGDKILYSQQQLVTEGDEK